MQWLPGSPLGNTGLSWSDVLLGNMPNVYVYAANNPSESIVAKRRGYGTIVSHNVPPYGRAGGWLQPDCVVAGVWLWGCAREMRVWGEGICDVVGLAVLGLGWRCWLV